MHIPTFSVLQKENIAVPYKIVGDAILPNTIVFHLLLEKVKVQYFLHSAMNKDWRHDKRDVVVIEVSII